MLPILREASRYAGGPAKLAEAIGVSRQALYLWDKVPAERVPAIVDATGGALSRHQLRPDLWEQEAARATGNGEAA
jgi:DNA-binding transcriptional regulator YdaS (Cro superfamily)